MMKFGRYLLPLILIIGMAAVCPAVNAADEGVSFVSSGISAEATTSFPDRMLQELLNWTVDQGIPGVVLGVTTPEGTWFGTAGVANTATKEPMSPQHQIRLASVTKTFTAVLIWSLIEDGVLSLKDPVNKWITPGLVPKGEIITIGMLLNHTSGLYDHENAPGVWKMTVNNPTYRWTNDKVLAVTRAHRMNFYPGKRYSYCNTGYYILGMIAEAATGKKVSVLMNNRIFARLSMYRTSVQHSGKLSNPCTPGYCYLDGYSRALNVLRWNFSWDWTAGAGVSTAYDMLVWAAGLSAGKILKPSTLEKAWTVKYPSTMGYGFEVARNIFGDRRIGHTGLNPGTTTDWFFYPGKERALFLGLNISNHGNEHSLNTAVTLLAIRNTVEALLGWNVHVD
jgi:D-alanyl-D-alanine carboxypeptidase